MVKCVLILIFLCAAFALCECGGCRKNTFERKLNVNQRSLIVQAHNKFRSLIKKGLVKGQPRAQKMTLLKWDSRLAKQAQKIADTCKFEHVRVKDGRWSVGQNLYKISWSGPAKGLNVTTAVQSWFDEYKLYKYPHYKTESGHYSQLIWANTKYVGCGFTGFKAKGKFKYQKILVCNYGPAGNVEGQAPYKRRSKKSKKA